MRFVNGGCAAAAAAWLTIAACAEERDVVGFTGAAGSCASCHSAPGEGPPFRDAGGGTSPALPGVGAHDAHLQSTRSLPLDCGACHRVPRSVGDPGHLEDLGPGDLAFGPLARSRGAPAVFDGSTCAVYCHGQFTGGEAGNRPTWTGGAAAAACGTCHGAFPAGPPSGRHERHVLDVGISCDTCHGPILRATHVNGLVELSPTIGYDQAARTCQVCHGPARGSWQGG